MITDAIRLRANFSTLTLLIFILLLLLHLPLLSILHLIHTRRIRLGIIAAPLLRIVNSRITPALLLPFPLLSCHLYRIRVCAAVRILRSCSIRIPLRQVLRRFGGPLPVRTTFDIASSQALAVELDQVIKGVGCALQVQGDDGGGAVIDGGEAGDELRRPRE
ncbi:hypothetical protein MIMGU_mgv1a015321mg [Erythranthe guttata]|uniref:Uncharacterized protein n=1 Tax=Erythranthe guttata TaxID=4155 RepID=A0A022QNF4_ERYGU|nr:hypothetical protein MIMGU_mgv1a015321mg [Erythranthe guttata]